MILAYEDIKGAIESGEDADTRAKKSSQKANP
jgi:hypothetical protein